MRWFTLALALSGAVAFHNPARASLIGQQFNATYFYPTLSMPYQSASFAPPYFLVDGGVRTVGSVEDVTSIVIDVAATSLRVTFQTSLTNPVWTAKSFNGVVLTSSTALDITGGTVDSTTTLAGFDDARLEVTGNEIRLNWQGLAYNSGTVVDVTFLASPVSEPVSLGLVGMALLGFGLFRRHRVAVAVR